MPWRDSSTIFASSLGVGIAIGHAHHLAADRAVRHELRDVGADVLLLVGGALRRQIDRAASVRIDEDGRQSLREQRLPVLQLLGRRPGRRASGRR
jgi:hypothetical protein